VEFEGTFPLPEAQLDRFLLQVSLGYPAADDELHMLQVLEGAHPIGTLAPVVDGTRLPALQQAIWGVHVEQSLREYMVRLAQATRRHPDLTLGVSPRGTLALFRAAQAQAALQGRDYVLPDDIKLLAEPVLRHRLLLRPESALRGRTTAEALRTVLAEVELTVE
jgi:MoxR-like ATPase|nr:MoxR family ATPase [Chloroflexaceae bacterium]